MSGLQVAISNPFVKASRQRRARLRLVVSNGIRLLEEPSGEEAQSIPGEMRVLPNRQNGSVFDDLLLFSGWRFWSDCTTALVRPWIEL